MFAAPKMTVLGPAGMTSSSRPVVAAHRRRVVAIAHSPMELLRPESDLARTIAGVPHVDLLVATDDLPVPAPGPLGVLGDPRLVDSAGDELDPDDTDRYWSAALQSEISGLGLPNLRVHRLRLREPLSGAAEADLVAALSELVGFDPEPGVYCLAPVPPAGDANRAVLSRAAQRIAQVYGLPLLRYRCLELCVVGDSSS